MTNIRREPSVYLQGVQVCGGLFCVLLLDANEHYASESKKYNDYFGWNIFKNVEMIFDLFDNSD